MADQTDARVAVYIDFDNIIISRYDQRSKRGQFHKDEARSFDARANAGTEIAKRLEDATVDLSAVLDFASSFGTIAVSRAYADWSVAVNASYQKQLIERAVDLVQLFPTVASMKNGADIRLAVDVVEDLFRLSDLTHVVIVAGDSDYIALAQRCKQLGRYVVGIGVAGATSKALAAACNEFADYDALPGVKSADEPSGPAPSSTPPTDAPTRRGRRSKPLSEKDAATELLVRALQLSQAKNDDEWLSSAAAKSQMLRMDPTFQERSLGFKSFTDFVRSLEDRIELDEKHPSRRLRLRQTA
ncbi:NYN domain-containing protein [Lacisediminihabitans profunda]|uniref:NYN domain-containing protein n=1 Tax=Lacisediminihabitans profunda TaxID=2594790 RepID=A0A5C8UMV0_9MICO|nr:NYN domain-containing protein [Lacisediminihabitans profunda]TXN29715.1 NYN domain-containing protein [Lacisediminihabitans profunda]